MEITEKIARKVLSVVNKGLADGLGEPIPGHMCVEAAVCYALGLDHSDDPGCVAPSLRQFKIRLNDSGWSSKKARAKGLRRLALIQLGSRDNLDEAVFASELIKLTEKQVVKYKGTPGPATENIFLNSAQKYLRDALVFCKYSDIPPPGSCINMSCGYCAASVDRIADRIENPEERNNFLSEFAEDVVQLLIKLDVPGKQWLHLTEK